MLTYHQVMTTDLALLTKAAEKWDRAAKDFETVQKTYNSQVRNVGIDGSWTGIARTFAETANKQTYEQYTAAATEARAIASVLRDAHTQFTELRGKLKTLLAEAAEKDIKIDDNGRATYTKKAGNDPDRQTALADIRKAEDSWTSSVAALVQAFDDADQGVKLALSAAVQDTDKHDGIDHSFNAKAEGDIEKVEGRREAELATKLSSTGHLDAKELAEMQRLFRDNEKSKEFSQTLLSTLGPEATIKFTNKVNEIAHDSGTKNKADYLSLDRGMARSLGAAMQVPGFRVDGKQLAPGTQEYYQAYKKWLDSPDGSFYKHWMHGLKAAGVKQYKQDGLTDNLRIGEGREQKVRGYQCLVTMMQNGGNYSPQFLHDLTDDMMAAEKKDKNIWDLYGPFSKKDTKWFAYDPVDRALGIMSKNPEASTSYFDPKAVVFDREANDGAGVYSKNDRFDYLREKRDWAVMNTVDTKGNWEHTGPDAEAKDGHKGFGEALQAAATGRAPGVHAAEGSPQHTDTQVRIFEDIASKYADYTATNPSGMPANMRQSMSYIVADYPKDVHDILGKGGDVQFGDHQAHIGRKELTQFIRAASEDGGAYQTMHYSQTQEAARMVERLGHDDFTKKHTSEGPDIPLGGTGESARALGALDGVRAEVIAAHRDSEIFQNNWNAKINYHAIGAPLTLIPYAGDSIQRYVDVGTSEYANNLNDKVTAKSKDELINLYDEGQKELEAMLIKRAEALDVKPHELKVAGGRGQDLLTQAGYGYADGIGRSRRSTGEVS
ncbi:hypothetical protein ACSNOH_21320 [Streptomyces sp. URMC 127]|uniref:hypothetical protein n=1 Tax=Streptomyces sp. URMC 127 TaxID=3423402 RepID=UPI003F1B1172